LAVEVFSLLSAHQTGYYQELIKLDDNNTGAAIAPVATATIISAATATTGICAPY
jgi:hypothetical protein